MGSLGQSIEDYDVYEEVGRGGFAVVYRAMCCNTGREVAIKKIDRRKIKEEGVEHQISQEIAIHSGLKHPSILQLYTHFIDRNYVYLVVELCHGELQSWIKNRVLSEAEACLIMKQVVEGLLYLHSKHIIHRDIKLANLLLTKSMSVKIADFGLAKQLQWPGQKQMTMCGTPNYISPEVASRGAHGLEADIWGLGIMLYTCMVGKPPFDSDVGLKSTLTNVVFSELKFPSYLSLEAQDLLRSLLQKNPNDRIKLNKILEHPFILKFQGSNGIPRPPQRCLSYDSGVATASYLTSQAGSAYSQPQGYAGRFESSQQSRPSSPPRRNAISSVENGICSYTQQPSYHAMSEGGSYHRGTGHSCPSQGITPSIGLPYQAVPQKPFQLIPNRYMPFSSGPGISPPVHPEPTSQCNNSQVGGENRNVPSITERTCSHTWKQCKQCSHQESCGCCITNQSQYSNSAPKYENNHQSHTKSNSGRERNVSGGMASKPPTMTVAPLNTRRLWPIKQKTKNCVCSILQSGDVCLEFLKTVHNRERVWEVMRISSDGMRIIMYQPKVGKGVEPSNSPPPLPSAGADAIYNYDNLPEKHWKKYSYAFKFVDLVKSRFPKITYYSEHAKSILMENEPVPDFQCTFYQGGKMHKTQSKVTVTLTSGKSWTFDFFDDVPNFSSDAQFMWEHFRKCLDHCGTINKTLSDIGDASEESVFPLIIGRRPKSKGSPLQDSNNSNKENMSPQSVVNIPTMRGYEASIASSRRGPSTKQHSSRLKPFKQILISGIGNVSQFSNGEIHVKYFDQSTIIVNSTSAEVIFLDTSGNTVHYTEGTDMPNLIKSRLAQMPYILKELMESS